jgi:starch phosphorylase
LAACFLDSLATLEIPSLGYGIRYEYGIFEQEIVDGWQVERTDKWLRFGNPWDLVRPEWAVEVYIGGHTERSDTDELRAAPVRWVPERTIKGVPYDTPILGYRTNTANTLRLWRAEAPESFDFARFNRGDYYGAVNNKDAVGEHHQGALPQRRIDSRAKSCGWSNSSFFVSCSLQDMIRILRGQKHGTLERFHESSLSS